MESKWLTKSPPFSYNIGKGGDFYDNQRNERKKKRIRLFL